MLKYRSKRTGKVVEMAEPQEIEREADQLAEELAKSDDKADRKQAEFVRAKGQEMAGHARRTLDRYNEGSVWERVTDDDPAESTDAGNDGGDGGEPKPKGRGRAAARAE